MAVDDTAQNAETGEGFVEEVQIDGHIVDSLILPKILDEITNLGGHFEITDIQVGQRRTDPSSARLRVSASTLGLLEEILATIVRHGAVPTHQEDVQIELADMEGAFPEGFYCSTNQDTEIRLNGVWVTVGRQEMDCGVKVDRDAGSAVCVPMCHVHKGDAIVIGRLGVRVRPLDSIAFPNSTSRTALPTGHHAK